jgi:hypothetical protein
MSSFSCCCSVCTENLSKATYPLKESCRMSHMLNETKTPAQLMKTKKKKIDQEERTIYSYTSEKFSFL